MSNRADSHPFLPRRDVCLALAAAASWGLAGCLGDDADPADQDATTNESDGADGGSEAASTEDEPCTDEGDADGPVVEEQPRIDEPPYEIQSQPHNSDSDDEWNEDYLGEHMASEPSLAFDVWESGFGDEETETVIPSDTSKRAFFVDVLRSADELADAECISSDQIEVDFDESVLLYVELRWGTISQEHRWVRVEDSDNGVHLHGYYTDPRDHALRSARSSSLLVVDRPQESLKLARVSLTVNEHRRIHFNSTEGVVILDE